MANEKNNMDNFLRESLSDISVKPSQSVWKGITKRLIILELLRLNFTNVGKIWLYSGLATVATISGLTYFSLTHQTEEKTQTAEITQTEQTTNNPEQREIIEIVSKAEEDISSSESLLTDLNSEKDENFNANSSTKNFQNKENNSKNIKPEINKIQQFNNSSTQTVEKNYADIADNSPKVVKSLPINSLAKPYRETNLPGIGRAQMIPFSILNDDEDELKKTKNTTDDFIWYLGADYNPEWPLSTEDMYVNNHQLTFSAGIEYKKWQVNVGIGLRTEKTPSMYASHFRSYDSVGYFYDIDYYEVNPINPDSIIIYYTIENLYDSVVHQSQSHGPNQKRRWLFIPVSIGYQLYASSKYQLYGKIFGQYGWQNYTEEADMNLKLAAGSTMEDITPEANPNYLQIGVGFENNFNVFPRWWIYAEPRINYYINTPYSINQTTGNGPYSFGFKVGVKYKFKRR